MDVSGQLHAPAALPRRKSPPQYVVYGAGWTPDPVCILLKLPGFEPQLHGRVAYNLVTILTELSWLLLCCVLFCDTV